jgi:F0F1-type ATP synthase alpha subunit
MKKIKIINQMNNSLFQKENEIENKYNSILAENNNKITQIQTSLLQKDREIVSQNKRINKLLNQKKKYKFHFMTQYLILMKIMQILLII